MADRRSLDFGPRLDIEQLLLEAQHRWLRPAEICEILRNHQKFQISSEPPNRPPSGSLFLFDRKVLRYFRKDGHNWRKKKDGKTVKEAHEKLKVGSVDVLHCYYAHGEENENFQRRCYWMLESDLMHVVFVHYLEVKGSRTSIGGIKENSHSANGSTSGNIDSTTSPTSTLQSLSEDADSGDSQRASSTFQAFPEPQIGSAQIMGNHGSWASVPGANNISQGHGIRVRESDSQRPVDLGDWAVIYEQSTSGYHNLPYQGSFTQAQPAVTGVMTGQDNTVNGENSNAVNVTEQFGNPLPVQSNWQALFHNNSGPSSSLQMGMITDAEMINDLGSGLLQEKSLDKFLQNYYETSSDLLGYQNQQPAEDNLQAQHTGTAEYVPKSNFKNDKYGDGSMTHPLPLRRSLLDTEEGLKKVDSFSRWISRELGEVENLQMQSSSGGIAWSSVESETGMNGSSLSPSLSQDQRFTIIDFSPKWSYTDSEVEVMVIGSFLTSTEDITKYNWSCMFGEVEVPAEILVDGVLCCFAPPHTVGQVPFYVTCSNRFACSEVREFEFRPGFTKNINASDVYGISTAEAQLCSRLERLLTQRSSSYENHIFKGVMEKRELISKIMLLKEEHESHLPETTHGRGLNELEAKDQVIWELMPEKLFSWLIHKVTEDGKGPNILDEEGQGAIHFAAALGYDWAIRPILAAGISVNFRDVNGWTALHWAAFGGREQTVAVLVSRGADAGALADPSPEFPLGTTAADLASGIGHKGISGFLAESSLTGHLVKLTMKESKEHDSSESSGIKAVQTVSERTATPLYYGDMPDGLPLKDSLTALCNATQAKNRIYQVFRMQSFQRKQQSQIGDSEFDLSDESTISFLASKSGKPGKNDAVHAAAVQIQKKYRGWTKRKEFLLIRQRIVKLQAHVRGHQVRKQYRTVVWSVGILEKVILRWRRKGSGLRGFRREATDKQVELDGIVAPQEDEYDFLKEGRKQTEERLEKALTRVKSMVRYPEAQAQYRRLLNVTERFRENEAARSALNATEEEDGEEANIDDLIDIDSLLDDDTFMSIAFE